MGNRLIRTENEQANILTQYCNRLLERKLDFRRDPEEIRLIKGGVQALVERIMSEVAILNMMFEICRCVLVGSIPEETKIREPDEFDYIVVLKQLSNTETVQIKRECAQNRRGYAHVIIKDAGLRQKWRKWMFGDKLKSTQSSRLSRVFLRMTNKDDGLRQEFNSVVKKAMQNVRRRNGHFQTELGTLSIRNTLNRHGPAFTLAFKWTSTVKGGKNLDISVDITPGIEGKLANDVVLESDVSDQRFLRCLRETNRYMVIPCNKKTSCDDGLCFRLTFTETEVKLLSTCTICNNSAENCTDAASCTRKYHVKCYKVLKYLFNGGSTTRYQVFSSYALKTFVIKHMSSCERVEQMALCVKELIKDCKTSVESRRYEGAFSGFTMQIPSLFIKSHSIFDRKMFSNSCDRNLIAISEMEASFDKISRMKKWEKANIKKVNDFWMVYWTASPRWINSISIGVGVQI